MALSYRPWIMLTFWQEICFLRTIILNYLFKILKLTTNKSPGPDGFSGEVYQTLREELTSTPLKLFQKTAEEITFPRPATLIPNQTKISQKKIIKGQYHW